MFVPCPHCGFLLALIVTGDGVAHSCPRCDGVLPGAGAAAAGTAPATAANDPAESTGTQIATVAAGEADDGIAAAPDPISSDPISSDPISSGPASPDPAAPDPIATLIAVDAATPAAPAAAEPANARVGTAAPAARRRGRKPGTPSFARPSQQAAVPLGPRWPGLVVIAALLLVLATQLLLVERATLAASSQWRPLLARACAVLLCELPPWHEPAAIAMLDRGVQPHPRLSGVLAVRASFRNDARFPQPWPTLLLNLADVDGRPVAQGLLSPREYGAPADGAMLLAPGQVASIGFSVREPEPRSVAFSFEFR